MALIKVKDLREAIQMIKMVLEKLDQIYHDHGQLYTTLTNVSTAQTPAYFKRRV